MGKHPASGSKHFPALKIAPFLTRVEEHGAAGCPKASVSPCPTLFAGRVGEAAASQHHRDAAGARSSLPARPRASSCCLRAHQAGGDQEGLSRFLVPLGVPAPRWDAPLPGGGTGGHGEPRPITPPIPASTQGGLGLIPSGSESTPGMESAIFSALLASPALSNAAFRPQNNNREVCYCAKPSAAPGRRWRGGGGEKPCFPAGKLRHGAQSSVGAAHEPSWSPAGPSHSGWLCGGSPTLTPPEGTEGRGGEGCRPPQPPVPRIIRLDATRCQWMGANDTCVMGFRQGEGWGGREMGGKDKPLAGKTPPFNT